MNTIRPGVDLNKSFKKLKDQSEIMKGVDKDNPEQLAYGFSYLTYAIKTHLSECTEESKDDISELGIACSPGLYADTEGESGMGC